MSLNLSLFLFLSFSFSFLRMWNEMDALLAAPTFSSIFFSFFPVFSIVLYTLVPIAVKTQMICSLCFLRDDFGLKIQSNSEDIGHFILVLQSRENGWCWWIYYQSVKAAVQNFSTPNLSSDNFRDLDQNIKERTV